MGLMNAVLGNASEIAPDQGAAESGLALVSGERVEKAYKLIRDLILFTDRRLIIVDKQGLTGKKVEHHSIPYRSITHFSIETAGTFDLDAELNVFVSGGAMYQKTFGKGVDIGQVQAVLAGYILR